MKNNLNFKTKYSDGIGNKYCLIDMDTGEVITDFTKQQSNRFKLTLPFIKKYMIADVVLSKIGITNYGYLSYIIDKTLKNTQNINPGVLFDDGIIKKSAYYNFIKCLKDNNIVKKINKGVGYYYILNPYIACKSKTIEKSIIDEFIDGTDWIKEHKKFINKKV